MGAPSTTPAATVPDQLRQFSRTLHEFSRTLLCLADHAETAAPPAPAAAPGRRRRPQKRKPVYVSAAAIRRRLALWTCYLTLKMREVRRAAYQAEWAEGLPLSKDYFCYKTTQNLREFGRWFQLTKGIAEGSGKDIAVRLTLQAEIGRIGMLLAQDAAAAAPAPAPLAPRAA